MASHQQGRGGSRGGYRGGRGGGRGDGGGGGHGHGNGPEFGIEGLAPMPSGVRQRTPVGAKCWPIMAGPGTQLPYEHDRAMDPVDGDLRRDHIVASQEYVEAQTRGLWMRGYLVFTVPASAMRHDARCWGDINFGNQAQRNLGLLKALSFFLYAVARARFSDKAQIDLFGELILRNRLDLPVCTGRSATGRPGVLPERALEELQRDVFTRDNFGGYRLWAVLRQGSYGPEAMLRRALFHVQLGSLLIRGEIALEIKNALCMRTDQADRDAVVDELIALFWAREVAERKAKDGKKGGERKRAPDAPAAAAAPVDSDSDSDEDLEGGIAALALDAPGGAELLINEAAATLADDAAEAYVSDDGDDPRDDELRIADPYARRGIRLRAFARVAADNRAIGEDGLAEDYDERAARLGAKLDRMERRKAERAEQAAAAAAVAGAGKGRKRGKKRGKRAAPAPVADAEDDEYAITAQDEARLRALIYAVARMPHDADTRRRYRDMSFVSDPARLYFSVNSMFNYARLVLEPLHIQTRTHDPRQFERLVGLENAEWHECTDLAQLDPIMFGARSVMGFDASVDTLSNMHMAPEERATCRPDCVQMLAENYGLHADTLCFPLPHCVWRLTDVEPEQILPQVFPWDSVHFEGEMRALLREVRDQAVVAADAVAPDLRPVVAKDPATMHDLVGVLLATRRPRTVGVVPTDDDVHTQAMIDERQARRRTQTVFARGEGRPQGEDAADGEMMREAMLEGQRLAQAALRLPMDEFQCAEYNQLFAAEAKAIAAASSGASTQMEEIVNGLRPVAARFLTMWRATELYMERLQPEPHMNIAPDEIETWRYMRLCDMHRLLQSDLYDAIMGAISAGREITPVHRAMYSVLGVSGKAQFVRSFCTVPEMDMPANALVGQLLKLATAFNLQNGYIQYHELQAMALQASDLEVVNPNHMGLGGAPATGKTKIVDVHGLTALEGSHKPMDHQSEKAMMTRTFMGGHLVARDEALSLMINHTLKAQSADPQKMSTLKDSYSNSKIRFDRYLNLDNGLPAETHTVLKDYVRTEVFNFNYSRFGAGADMALANRVDIVLMLPRKDTLVRMVDRVTDILTEQRADYAAEVSATWREQQAVKTFLVLAVRTGLINSMNISMLRIMQAAAIAAAEHFMPSFCNATRGNARQLNYAQLCVYMTATYTVFNSEASPLLTYAQDMTSVHSIAPAYVNQLHSLMGPYLYANHSHGAMMVTRMVCTEYPPNYYELMRMITALRCRFKRGYMAQLYMAHGVLLVDDAVRARMFDRGDAAPPTYIQTLLDDEVVLDNGVNRRIASAGDIDAPVFAEISTSNGAAVSYAHDHGVPDDEAAPQARSVNTHLMRAAGHGSKPRGPAGSVVVSTPRVDRDESHCTDPNYLSMGESMRDASNSIMQDISEAYEVNPAIVLTVFEHMTQKTCRVPVFEQRYGVRGNQCHVNTLAFMKDPRDPEGQTVLYEERPMVREVTVNGRRDMQILTGAMMLPPHYLLFLMLTATENENTRERDTVIPLEIARHPGTVHRHSIRKRAGRLTSINATATHGIGLSRLMAADPSPAFVKRHVHVPQQEFTEDPEMKCFRDHMRKLYLVPDYHEWLTGMRSLPFGPEFIDREKLHVEPSARPSCRQFEQMFTYWVENHRARPGGSEAIVKRLYDSVSEPLPHGKTNMFERAAVELLGAPYPETEVRHVTIQRMIARGGDLGTQGRVTPEVAQVLDQNINTAKLYMRALEWRMLGPEWFSKTMALFRKCATLRHTLLELFSRHYPPGVVPMEPLRLSDHQQGAIDAVPGDVKRPSQYHVDFLGRMYEIKRHLRDVKAAMVGLRTDSLGAARALVLGGHDRARLAGWHAEIADAHYRIKELRVLDGTDAEHALVRGYAAARRAVRPMRAQVYFGLRAECVDYVTLVNAQALANNSLLRGIRDGAPAAAIKSKAPGCDISAGAFAIASPLAVRDTPRAMRSPRHTPMLSACDAPPSPYTPYSPTPLAAAAAAASPHSPYDTGRRGMLGAVSSGML